VMVMLGCKVGGAVEDACIEIESESPS
jgi:hypothetical protein